MIINDVYINAELPEILFELQEQLSINGINLLGKMRDVGNDIMVCCPYHKNGQERKPSAGIRKSDGQFHCFACGETHTLSEVISHCFSWNDYAGVDGWKWLLKNFVTAEIQSRKDIHLDMQRDNSKCTKRGADEMEQELIKYRYYHPYMYQRKLNDFIIRFFDIGYDEKTNCITFPQRDINGECQFIARRSVAGKFYHYPDNVEKIVYGIYELSQVVPYPTEVIICEGMFDALTCWVYGKYAVALNGIGSDLQFDTLRKMPCRKFILATDNDIAGRKARARIRRAVDNKVITEYVLPTHKKDINELTEEEFNNLQEVF